MTTKKMLLVMLMIGLTLSVFAQGQQGEYGKRHDEIKKLILERKYSDAVMLSAFDIETKNILIDKIKAFFQDQFFSRKVKLPYSKSENLAYFYEHAVVENISYLDDAMHIDCVISKINKSRFAGLI